MALRAGVGGLEWAHPTEKDERGGPKRVRFEAGQEIDPAQLPAKSRENIEGLIAAGMLVKDEAIEVKTETPAADAGDEAERPRRKPR